MTENVRNLMVGTTVLVALVLLGGMILIFQELPGFVQVGWTMVLHFPDSGRLNEGADVLLVGKRVGRVTTIEFTSGDPRLGVTVRALIDRDVKVPGDVNAYIVGGGLGAAVIEMRSDGYPPGSERTDASGRKLEWLPRKPSIVVQGSLARGGGLIPAELRDAFTGAAVSMKTAADHLGALLAPPGPPSVTGTAGTTAPAGATPPGNLHVTLAKINTALDDIHATLGDSENRANFKAALKGLQQAAEAAGKAMTAARELLAKAKGTFQDVSDATRNASKRFDDLTGTLIAQADRLGKVLAAAHQAATKLHEGQGSAAKLLNDPRLYNTLVDATEQLEQTLDELSELLAKWRREGVRIKW